MLEIILCMYISLIPPILSGILNMIWCKLKILNCISIPIDFKKNFFDGKRIFGDNKTWKGLVGYIFINIIASCIWGMVCKKIGIESKNYFYVNYSNTVIFNIFIGALLGLAYALFELPNSFIKRRLGIIPGKTTSGIKKYFFIILDQLDSVLGCVLVLTFFYKMNLGMFIGYILLGTITHIVFNMLLFFMNLRKNMF